MMSVVHAILGDPHVSAAAVLDDNAQVFERGFGERAPQLVETARVLSAMFRRASPPMAVADLLYAEGRIILAARSGGGLLVAMGSPSMDLERIRACARSEANDDAPEAAPLDQVSSAPRLRAAETIDDVSTWVSRVTVAARVSLGGPVIRNYLKKSISALLPAHPSLATLKVDLAGAVSFEDAGGEDPVDMAAAVTALLESFVLRAAVVAPELRSIDIVALRGRPTNEQESPSAQENTR